MTLQTPLVGHGSKPLTPPALLPPIPCPPAPCPPAPCPPIAEAPAEPAPPPLPPLEVPALLGAPPALGLPPTLGLPPLPAVPPGTPPAELLPPGPPLPPVAGVPPVAPLPPLEFPPSGFEPPLPAFESVGDEEHATRRESSRQQLGEKKFMTVFTVGPPRPLPVSRLFCHSFKEVTIRCGAFTRASRGVRACRNWSSNPFFAHFARSVRGRGMSWSPNPFLRALRAVRARLRNELESQPIPARTFALSVQCARGYGMSWSPNPSLRALRAVGARLRNELEVQRFSSSQRSLYRATNRAVLQSRSGVRRRNDAKGQQKCCVRFPK
jgi:hypothetical protein